MNESTECTIERQLRIVDHTITQLSDQPYFYLTIPFHFLTKVSEHAAKSGYQIFIRGGGTAARTVFLKQKNS